MLSQAVLLSFVYLLHNLYNFSLPLFTVSHSVSWIYLNLAQCLAQIWYVCACALHQFQPYADTPFLGMTTMKTISNHIFIQIRWIEKSLEAMFVDEPWIMNAAWVGDMVPFTGPFQGSSHFWWWAWLQQRSGPICSESCSVITLDLTPFHCLHFNWNLTHFICTHAYTDICTPVSISS